MLLQDAAIPESVVQRVHRRMREARSNYATCDMSSSSCNPASRTLSNRSSIFTRKGVLCDTCVCGEWFLTFTTVCHTLYVRGCVVPVDAIRAIRRMDALENLRLELRRGCLVLAVLAKLRSEYHGYALAKALKDSGLDIDENTLYPLLRRLESQKLLVSQWRVEDKRNKRFYRLSEEGQDVLERLLVEWRGINGAIENLLEAPLAMGRREA